MNNDACECVKTDNWEEIEAISKEALTPAIVDYINHVRQLENSESHLISILHKVQGHFGFLGRSQLDAVAQLLQVPTANVTGVATFYHFFRLVKPGLHTISVCLGTACYVKGALQIAEKIKDELSIDIGETSHDGVFTLEASRCLGTCGLAPVLMIDGEIHGQIKPEQIPALLQNYRLPEEALKP